MKTGRTAKYKIDETWVLEALSAVCEFANQHQGEDHVAEEIRAYAQGLGGVQAPPDGRVWGIVLKRAEKNGVISANGYAPTVSSNGSPKVLWHMIGA